MLELLGDWITWITPLHMFGIATLGTLSALELLGRWVG